MPSFAEKDRFFYLETPLGPDKLLLDSFTGQEGLNELFSFELNVLAENATTVDFDKLIGKGISFGILGAEADLPPRHFHGIASEISQGDRGPEFTQYRITVVPLLWVLSQRYQSRIFQHQTIPDILKKVLTGLDVAYKIEGTFYERDYCVQYQETDLDFLDRLVEEEGIYYYFKFSKGSHQLLVANTPPSHDDIDGDSTIIYDERDGGVRDEERINSWQKSQIWGSGKTTLWDHTFELPNSHLEAEKTVIDSIPVGKAQHKLKVGGNEGFEVYEFPGLYAGRFDGIDKSGGEQPADLTHIFEDNKRTVGIRTEEAEARMLLIHGTSNCRQLSAGHKFTLQRHFNADGQYVLESVAHMGREGDFRSSGAGSDAHYSNSFSAIPFALSYRPPRETEKPTIHGPQTAVVVGPAGEEIFTDKYGRVKVQFYWDRQGKNDGDSSCWCRVASSWAGQGWGSIAIPRIGMDVVVQFLEGDPDQPLITGCVYNAQTMPPYALPANKTVSTIKSHSSMGGGKTNFNELRFEDKKGSEQLFLHAEKDKDERVKNESREWVGADKHLMVVKSQMESVGGSLNQDIGGDHQLKIGGDRVEKVGGDNHLQITGKTQVKTGTNFAHEAGQEIHLKAGMKVIIEAGMQISLKGPGGFIDIGPAGVTIQGTMVLINSGGAAGSGSGSSPKDAKPATPDEADDGTKFSKM